MPIEQRQGIHITDSVVIIIESKTITITSQFPASIEEIWGKLQHIETLQYIAAPYATFKPVNGAGMVWKEGETSKFRLKIFGLNSMGIHTINVIQFNKDALAIYTNESNHAVPTWNHRIALVMKHNNITQYTDEIEIYAGWKTPFVCLWSYLFYKHRQRKWIKLLCERSKKA